MFGGVITEFRTRTFPAGVGEQQLAFHYICGGDSAASCELSVEIEERSATSYSRREVWSLQDSDKAIGATALKSSSWSHKIINLPASSPDTETQVIFKKYFSDQNLSDENICLSINKLSSYNLQLNYYTLYYSTVDIYIISSR